MTSVGDAARAVALFVVGVAALFGALAAAVVWESTARILVNCRLRSRDSVRDTGGR